MVRCQPIKLSLPKIKNKNYLRVITKSFCVFSSCALRESTSVSSRSTRIPSPPPLDDVTGAVVRLEVELELELELDISSRASSAESRFVDKLTIGL